jgi:acetylornithine deacetylase/succinyl-diaminopimelate desuccinylase-like protein
VSPDELDLGPDRLDREWTWECFSRLVGADTFARVGENRIAPDDARLAAFARDVAEPLFSELGAEVTTDGLNNVVGRFGPDRGSELLFVSYPALHHGNEMTDPLRARREPDAGDQRWVGLGAGQGKAALAGLCAAVRLLREQGHDLSGRVTLAISSEGGSSHTSARQLFAGFERRPVGAILLVGTRNRISLGNRGRVDVVIEISGRATHSSTPETGENPIPVVGEVQSRLAHLELPGEGHPQLGPRALVQYKLVCSPVAPHTIPERCVLVLDRRTLPGDAEEDVVAEIAELLDGLPVSVSAGPSMLPALVAEDAEVVLALQAGARHALGRELETFYPSYTFDAGYPCSLGIPTVMCGPSTEAIATDGILGEDSILWSDVAAAAATYAGAIASLPPA